MVRIWSERKFGKESIEPATDATQTLVQRKFALIASTTGAGNALGTRKFYRLAQSVCCSPNANLQSPDTKRTSPQDITMAGIVRTRSLSLLDTVHFVPTRRLGEGYTGLVPHVLRHFYRAARYARVVVHSVTILAPGTRKC